VPSDLVWEVVVVNNDSTDHTDAIIRAFADRLPVRRAFEPRRGLSRARNRAVDAAQGDYIIWTDDDVIVDPGWLAAYVEAFHRWPKAAVFGGPIKPRYEAPVVKWVVESGTLLHGPYALRDFGDEPILLSVSGYRLPYGANFALRSGEQRIFRYNPDLGIGPGTRRVGEEFDVVARVLESGAIGYWVPAARVEHCIGRERQTVQYVARCASAWGETVAFKSGKQPGPLLFGAPRWQWRRCAEEWLRYRLHRLIFSPAPVWVRHLQASAEAWGTIRYWRNARGRQ
jgi:glycosyltransferase involved in cell wall biosynthesis